MTKNEYKEWRKALMMETYRDAYWQWMKCRNSVKGELK